MLMTIFSRALFFMFCITTLAAPQASGQAYRGQITFLEDLAIRQYERGDHASAAREFQRILRVDPNDAVALEYLKKLAVAPETAAPSIDQVISDIAFINNGLTEYENEINDLEYLIRNLISENDALYQALYKRSREVVEMREQLYGTPYGEAYAAVFKDMPIDRVPQRLHQANDILPEPAMPISDARPVEEFNSLVAEILALEKNALGKTLFIERSQLMPQCDTALTLTRDILIERTLTTTEKHAALLGIKDQLWDINVSLKNSQARYAEAFKKLEAQCARVKAAAAQKSAADTKMFDELLADYAAKVKEIEVLKATARTRDNALPAFKPALISVNDQIQSVTRSMIARNQLLADLKTLLLQYKKEIIQKNATIQEHAATIHEQQQDLALTRRELDVIDGQATDLARAVADSDASLTAIRQDVDRTRGIITEQGNAAVHDAVRLREMEARTAELEALAAIQKNAITSSNKKIDHLKEKAAELVTELGLKEEALSAPALVAQKKKIEYLNKEVVARDAAIQSIQAEKIAAIQKTRDENKAALAAKEDAIRKLRDDDARLRQTMLEMAQEITAKSEALQDAATAVKDLSQKVAIKDERILDVSEELALLQQAGRTLHPPLEGERAQDEDAISDLEARLRASDAKLTAAETSLVRAASELASLKERLASRNAQAAPAASTAQPAADAAATRELAILQKKLDDARSETKLLKDDKKELMAQIMKLSSTAPVPEMPQPAAVATDEIRALSLDIKEKDSAIMRLQGELVAAQKALRENQAMAQASGEARSQEEIKQEAVAKLINERDDKIAALSAQLYALEQDRTAARKAQDELGAALAARATAEIALSFTEEEIALLQKKIQDLQLRLESAAKPDITQP